MTICDNWMAVPDSYWDDAPECICDEVPHWDCWYHGEVDAPEVPTDYDER